MRLHVYRRVTTYQLDQLLYHVTLSTNQTTVSEQHNLSQA
jgi:hypothetical protein